MAQVAFSVRMDAELKEQFENLCENLGMNMTTAFNIFAKAVVREKRIPFELSIKEKAPISCYPAGTPINKAADMQASYSAIPNTKETEDHSETLADFFELVNKLRLSTQGKKWNREELHER